MLATVFNFDSMSVRVQSGDDGQPWFVASDVCRVLGIARPEKAYARLDEDERGALSVGTPGGNQEMVVINESGLYSLIFSSRKDEAKRFKRWVTHDVLPTIRRTGGYSVSAPEASKPAKIAPKDAARIYCETFSMARKAGMDSEIAHNLAAQTKYEASGWWWQFKSVPKEAILAGPGKPLLIGQ